MQKYAPYVTGAGGSISGSQLNKPNSFLINFNIIISLGDVQWKPLNVSSQTPF